MKENFDYVMMPEYARDMAEQSSRAAGIIDAMKQKQREMERGLIAAVLAAGGELVIGEKDQIDAERASLRIERRMSDGALILSARR